MASADGISRELALLSKARKALVECRSLDEVCDIRDKAEAVRVHCKSAKLSLDALNYAADIKLRAERRAGTMLAEMEKNKGAATRSTDSSALSIPTLDELGITHDDSSKWQREAAIPDELFEAHVESFKSAGKELTTASVLKLAKKVASGEPIETNGVEVIDDRPTELSLCDALDRINAAVRAVLERWPKDCLETLGRKLVQMGNEILETGGLRE